MPLRFTSFEFRSLFLSDLSELAIFIIFFKPGNVLLFHILRQSTIGAEGLNFRVRDGIGCGPFAIITRHKLIIFLKYYVNSKKKLYLDLVEPFCGCLIFGGRDKNWTYDLYDVNVAFYHWTTRPIFLENFLILIYTKESLYKLVIFQFL